VQFGDYICKNVPNGTWSGYEGILINSGIYSSPKKGCQAYSDYTYVNYRENGNDYIKIYFSYCYLIGGRYFSPEDSEDLSIDKEFYLEWRPGAKPDYSDIAQQLAKISVYLQEFLMDGLDSGESEEIEIREDTVLKAKIREKKNEIQVRRKVRV
jgi:hypothetical protein